MKLVSPCLVVILAGAVMTLSAGIALATQPAARGDQAIRVAPTTTKAPPLPKQKRGIVTPRSKFFACPYGNGVCVRSTTLSLTPHGGQAG